MSAQIVSRVSPAPAVGSDGTELWTLSLDLGEDGHYYSTRWPIIGGDGVLYILLYDSYDMDSVMKLVRLSQPTATVTVNALDVTKIELIIAGLG